MNYPYNYSGSTVGYGNSNGNQFSGAQRRVPFNQAYNFQQQYGTYNHMNMGNNYDLVALQMRIVKARQVNFLCKQSFARNILLNRSAPAQDQYPNNVSQKCSDESYRRQQYREREQYPSQQQHLHQLAQPPISPQVTNSAEKVGAPPSLSQERLRAQTAVLTDVLDKQLSASSLQKPISNTRAAEEAQPTMNQAENRPPTHTQANKPPQKAPAAGAAFDDGDDEEDDAVPFTSRPVPVLNTKTKAPREDAKILSSLAETMTQTVTENVDTLKKLSAARKKQLAPTEKAKRRAENFIKISANTPVMMPLWRHKLNGRVDPPKESILKGARLFRLVVRSLVLLIIKPLVQNLKRKLTLRERQRKELQKSLRIVSSSLDDWLGKIVQLPLSSVTQDGSLNFEPVESFGSGQPLRTRLLQLKVRLKGVVMSIVKSGMPSELITDFLVTLVEDGNYFTAGVLWDCEVDRLDFSSLGATRDIVPLATVDTPETDVEIIPGEDGSEVRINIARARLILQNFLFIRVLVNHLLLSPWCYNLCGKPSSRALKRCIYNHRMLATGIYELVRGIDPALPAVEPRPFTGALDSAQPQDGEDSAKLFVCKTKSSEPHQYVIGDILISGSKKQKDSATATSAALVAGTNPFTTSPATRINTTAGAGFGIGFGLPALTGRVSSAAAQRIAAPDTVLSGRRISAANAQSPNSTGTLATTGTVPATSGASATTDESADRLAAPATPPTVPLTNLLLGKLAKYVGITDVAVFEPTKGSIENYLLELRGEFTTLPALHSLLIPPTQVGILKMHLDEWFPELKAPLREWLRQLVVHVLKRRQLLKKIERDKKEAVS